MFFSGLIIGFFNSIRAFSAIGPLLFIVVLLLSSPWSWSKRFLSLGIICAGLIIIPLYFNVLYQKYDTFASRQLTYYQRITDKHIFWHSVYIGLGFLDNDFGIRYDDNVGINKAISIDSEAMYPSVKYEQVLKKEVFTLIKHHPEFILRIIFAKIGVLFSFVLLPVRGFKGWLYFNLLIMLSFMLAFLYRKPWKIELAFLVAALFNALFGIIIMPMSVYLSGFVACVVLYSIVSINYALEKGLMHDIVLLFKKQKRFYAM